MVLGADTGFFIALGRKHPRASELWNRVITGEDWLIVSVLTVAEYYAHHINRGTLDAATELVMRMQRAPNIVLREVSLAIAARSARYRTGMDLATVDSIILATCVIAECQVFLTTDSAFMQDSVRNIIPVELLS